MCWPPDYIVLLCSLSDESEREEEKERLLTQEEEDIDIMRRWVEVGATQLIRKERQRNCYQRLNIFPCLSFSLFFFFLLTCLLPISLTIFDISDCYVLFPPSLQGLRLLQGASVKREEARKLEAEAKKMEAEGWGKLREAVTGSEVEGLYGLLRGVTSSSHHLSSRPFPS